jgi:hypothetical protein
VISIELAARLGQAGLRWEPEPGDLFMVPDRDLDRDVFVVSDMVVEVDELPTGRLLRFNGTTEWALDSLHQADAVWLPREDQLRERLGPAFVSLGSTAGGFVVEARVSEATQRHIDLTAEDAYARALLAVLGG